MTPSPLWICLIIAPGKEFKAHQLFIRHFISSLPPVTRERRINQNQARSRQSRATETLLSGYALVAHDGSELLESRLLRLTWPHTAETVVSRILGAVNDDDVRAFLATVQATAPVPSAPRLKAGDKARIRLACGYTSEVRISMIKGGRARVLLDGRNVEARLDQLEAAE